MGRVGLWRSEQFSRDGRSHLFIPSQNQTCTLFYFSRFPVYTLYSASVCPVVDIFFICAHVVESLNSLIISGKTSTSHISMEETHAPPPSPSLVKLITPPPVKHECDMHIVHLYHRNTTHITSMRYIHTCTETLTEALNQVNVINLYWCSLRVSFEG